jgi:NADH-quinone oxidoreductase subunit L
MDSFATITNNASEKIKGLQSGSVQQYVWVYILGALLLAGVTIVCVIL